jgi:hypothetical protein
MKEEKQKPEERKENKTEFKCAFQPPEKELEKIDEEKDN